MSEPPKELLILLTNLADDAEAHIDQEYPLRDRELYTSIQNRYNRDMAFVRKAREYLAKYPLPKD